MPDFDARTALATAHPDRLARLRAHMEALELDAVIVPRADAHQGEYVADADARLRWLTGFSGSAGFAVITRERAGVFIDGRYRVQVRAETDPDHFTPVHWPETKPAAWLREALPEGGRVGYDPWLHTIREVRQLEEGLEGSGIGLIPVPNPVDSIWHERPDAPVGAARLHDDAIAGETAADKRARLAAELREAGQGAAVFTLPDSISWLLNIRGSDLPHNPVVQAFAILEAGGHVSVFADPAKFGPDLRRHLGNEVTFLPLAGFTPALQALSGPVRLDPGSAPQAVASLLDEIGIARAEGLDLATMPKAVKNAAELAGMRAAHLRDAAAMIRILHWLDGAAPGTLTELEVEQQLAAFRAEAGATDLSFATIAGSGPNGALPHYKASEASNRTLDDGDLLVLDSGGQYPDGTTDITRTIPIGRVNEDARDPYTRVLRGMIAISRARFPRGVTGGQLDSLARQFLWAAGLDYDHGTGHGVGAAMSVHEGPARISRVSDIPLQPGMILSNEPGYYREGAFGIRIENLIVVEAPGAEASPDKRDLLGFETITWVPIDRRLIDLGQMGPEEIAWLDAYHAEVRTRLEGQLSGAEREWLVSATEPLASASVHRA